MRTLLVVCGGAEAVPGIERVKALGVRVVVSDKDPQAPGFAAADDRILASTYDIEGTARRAREYRDAHGLDGVMSIAADVPRTVAAVANELGLPGLSRETAELATDKLEMKRRFQDAEVPIPWYAAVESAEHLAELRAEHPGPLVLKPVDSRGARGVLRVTEDTDLEAAFATALAQSPSKRAMVEEFLVGPQLSTESAILDGRVFTSGCSDRNYELLDRYAPFMIENGGCQPSAHRVKFQRRIDEVLGRAAAAIGLERGTLKGDVVLVDGRGPVLIEVAPRLSGGWFATDQIPLSTGVDLVQAAARFALGEEVDPDSVTPRHWEAVAVRYFLPSPGLLTAVHGVEELAREPGVHRVELFIAPGEPIEPITDHTKRAGLVITTGSTPEEAVSRAEDAVRNVRFEVEERRGTKR